MTAWTRRQFAGKAAQEIVPPRPRNPCWKGLRADSEEKREPVSDFNTGVVERLKALDPERPIREAVIRIAARVSLRLAEAVEELSWRRCCVRSYYKRTLTFSSGGSQGGLGLFDGQPV